jgi:hypothetical protein
MFVMVRCGVLFEARTEVLKYYLDELRLQILPDCWLAVSMHPEGPATGHLDIGFLGFTLSSSKC